MENVFQQQLVFENGAIISPVESGAWPGEYTSYIYWLARRSFALEEKPAAAELLVVADRHYEVFVNGVRVISRRNYFSGERYLLMQRNRAEAIAAALTGGDNTIEFLVRSDTFANKNYVRFHPLLWCEMRADDAEEPFLTTDTEWDVSVLQDWRPSRQFFFTHCFERMNLVPDSAAGVRGTPGNICYVKPYLVNSASLPPLFEWTDDHKRLDKHVPAQILDSGTWTPGSEVLCFNLHDVFGAGAGTLRAVVESPERRRIRFAASDYCACELTLNESRIAERNFLPGKDMQKQKDYLTAFGEGVIENGENDIVLQFSDDHKRFFHLQGKTSGHGAAGLWFSLIIHGMPEGQIRWQTADGRDITPVRREVELDNALAARDVSKPLESLKVRESPGAFSFESIRGKQRQFVLFDFACVKKGKVSFRIEASSPGRIYLSYGFEAGLGAVECSRNGGKAVDVVKVPAGISMYEGFEDRTFVYLDMAFEGFEGQVSVGELKVEERLFLDAASSSYDTDDEVLNRIWKASVRTAQICCDEIYMDNSEREHGQWLCSSPPNIAAGYYVFGGGREKAKKVLSEFAFHQEPNGALQGYAPGAWRRGKPHYQCHVGLYIRAVWRNYLYHGDTALAERLLPVLEKILSHWETYRNQDGLLEDIETVWLDWGVQMYSYAPGGDFRAKGDGGVLTGMNAYYLGALAMVGELAGAVGAAETAACCASMADETARSMKKLLFDRAKNLFRDGLYNQLAEQNFSQQANAACALYGALPPDDCRSVLQTAFEECRAWDDIIPASPDFALIAGEALFEAGLHLTAFEWIRRHEKMTKAPAGTIWEFWTPHKSLCQGTGSSLAYHLARYHAGLYPAEPGFAVIGVCPYHGGSKRLRAQLNTHFGLIGVEWERMASGFDYRIALPPALRDRDVAAAPGVSLTFESSE